MWLFCLKIKTAENRRGHARKVTNKRRIMYIMYSLMCARQGSLLNYTHNINLYINPSI